MSSRTASENQGLISRALFEVLDSIVAPRVREIVLDDALANANEAQLPTDPERLHNFVHGALRQALIQAVGEASVDAVAIDLERIVDMAAGPTRKRSTMESPAVSDERRGRPRRRTPSSRPRFQAVTPTRNTPLPHPRSSAPRPVCRSAPTPRFPASFAPARNEPSVPPISSGPYPRGAAAALSMAGVRSSFPPNEPGSSPLIIVASARPQLSHRLAKSLSSSVELVTIHSVFDLVRELSEDSGGRVVLLLDCEAPSIRPIAVAALAEDLPSKVQVVLWGTSPEQRARLVSVSPRCQTWIGVDLDTDVDDIAGRCAMLVC